MIPPRRDSRITSQPEQVTREDWCRGYFEYPGLTVQVLETQIIIPASYTVNPAAFLFKLANGELVAGARYGEYNQWNRPDAESDIKDEPPWMRSPDGGRSWDETPPWPSYSSCQMPGGEIISLGRTHLEVGDREGEYTTWLYSSTDNGYTHEQGVATLVGVPKMILMHHDSGRTLPWGWVDHSVTVLPDGSLLAGLHGRFESDVKYRVFVVRSTDRGKTWHYLSTVVFDLDPGSDRRQNGFCEPKLLVLPSGEILCFIRSGGTYNATFSPLYLSRSIDGGRSWSHADEIADRGVWPQACRMDSGVLALAYGRTGDWLAFSIDEGYHWIGHFCYFHGPQSLDGCSHGAVEEVEPGTLLVAYARTDFNDPCQSELLGTVVQVCREP